MNAAAERWFVPPWQVLPLAGKRCMVRNPLDGAAIELTSGEYAVLSSCSGCRSLDEHEALAVTRLGAPAEHRPAIRALLQRCAESGLLSPVSSLVDRCGPGAQPTIAPLAGVVIRTCDRPALLTRLLASASRLEARAGVAYRWYILDDSRHEDNRRRNREALARHEELAANYVDLAAQPLALELTAAFPQYATEIGWLLGAARADETTYGRPLNDLLLRFAGKRLLLLEDDATVESRRPGLSRAGAEVSLDAEGATWYESLTAALEACPEVDIDPIAAHERWLGRSLAEAWAGAAAEPGGLAVGNLPARLATSFEPGARVLFTSNHVLGDPGWSEFVTQQLDLGAETRQWLATWPEAADFAFDSQVQWRGPLALRLAPLRVLSTVTLSGFDNSVPIPPTLRAGRGADTLLGAAACCIFPEAWMVTLPFALPHVRDARRRWLRPTDRLVLPPVRLIRAHLETRGRSIDAQGADRRTETAGAMLLDLAAADDATLARKFTEMTAEYAAGVVFSISEQLKDPSLPETWKEVLRKWIVSPSFRLDTASLQERMPPLEAARSLAHNYGHALQAWPRLWAFCRERLP